MIPFGHMLVGLLALASSANGFVALPSRPTGTSTGCSTVISPARLLPPPAPLHRYNCRQSVRTASNGRLQMVGPRSRGHGITIQGAGGTARVIASTSDVPVRMMDYEEDELFGDDSFGVDEMEEGFSNLVGQEEREIVTQRRGQMDPKISFIATTLTCMSVGVGLWFTGKAFIGRQETLVQAFGDEMSLHTGDEEEMRLCFQEYSGKLGPMQFRTEMYKAYLTELGRKKAVSIESTKAVQLTTSLLGFSKAKAAELIVEVARDSAVNQANFRFKLYFWAIRMFGDDDPAAMKKLAPLRENILESYDSPDSEEYLQASLKDMAKIAFKKYIADNAGKSVSGGWEVLGLTTQQAIKINEEVVSQGGFKNFYETGGDPEAAAVRDPDGAALLKQLTEKMEDDAKEVKDERDPVKEGALMSYECTVCGYKMFVAKGREFKFFGDDFKCPECGAGKNKFKVEES